MKKYSIEEIKAVMPANMRQYVTEEYMELLHNTEEDLDTLQAFRDNFVLFSDVMQGNKKYNIVAYSNAVRYVTYKRMGFTNSDAYFATFPDRVAEKCADIDVDDIGARKSKMKSFVSMYASGELVRELVMRSTIPDNLMFADYRVAAMNKAFQVMQTGTDKNALEAAKIILDNTRAPENDAGQLKIGDGEGMSAILNTLKDVAASNRVLLENGRLTLADTARQNLVIEGVVSEQ